jgi:hypothetical protein
MAACASPPSTVNTPLKFGMTKKQVVALYGFPASAALNSNASQGAPGFESWTYYQVDAAGNVSPQTVIFGNNIRNLGKVVTYDTDFGKYRLLNLDDPDDLRQALKYEAHPSAP